MSGCRTKLCRRHGRFRGTGSLASVDDSAFLVRLRRSNEFADLGGQTETGVGSSGPSLPLTFGKATTIQADDPSATYSARRDGLTVRATAIAAVRPAMHVGLPQVNPAQPGVTRFALLDNCVQAPTGAPVTLTVSVNPDNRSHHADRRGYGHMSDWRPRRPVRRHPGRNQHRRQPASIGAVGDHVCRRNVAHRAVRPCFLGDGCWPAENHRFHSRHLYARPGMSRAG